MAAAVVFFTLKAQTMTVLRAPCPGVVQRPRQLGRRALAGGDEDGEEEAVAQRSLDLPKVENQRTEQAERDVFRGRICPWDIFDGSA